MSVEDCLFAVDNEYYPRTAMTTPHKCLLDETLNCKEERAGEKCILLKHMKNDDQLKAEMKERLKYMKSGKTTLQQLS